MNGVSCNGWRFWSLAGAARNGKGRIVTEFGVAQLRGCTLAQRAEGLNAIAHPDFRAGLLALGEPSSFR